METRMQRAMLAVFALVMTGCTDARCSKVMSLGNAADVECYSGGKAIYSGRSTGKVSSEEGSDGYFFRDSKSGKLMEVSGDCRVTYVP